MILNFVLILLLPFFMFSCQNPVSSTGSSGYLTGMIPEDFEITSFTADHQQIRLVWNESIGATGYKVKYRKLNEVDFVVVDSYAISPMVITGLQNGQVYVVKVTAYNPSGERDSQLVSTTPNGIPVLSYNQASGTLGVVGTFMSVAPTTLVNNGTPITNCAVKVGSTPLPAWAVINPVTCVISGVPDSRMSQTTFTIVVTNAGGSSEANLTIEIDTPPPLAPPISVNSSITSNPNLVVTINTGIGASGCLSSMMAFTVNSSTPPTVFNLDCDSENFQMEEVFLGNDGPKIIRLWVKDQYGKISPIPTVVNVTLDTTAPTGSINNMVNTIKGNSLTQINFSANDSVGISALKLYYRKNGESYSLISNLTANSTSYSWLTPSDDTPSAQLKIQIIDLAGNTTEAETEVFVIDSTGPSPPSVSVLGSVFLNTTTLKLSVGSCVDRAKIFVSELSTTPSFQAAGWQNCSTNVGGISATLVPTDGTKILYVWAQDGVGNLSASISLTVILDRVVPTINLNSFSSPEILKGSSNKSINWNASDENFDSNPISIEISENAGNTWTLIQSNLSNSGTYNWSVPSINGINFKIKISAIDRAGNKNSVISNSTFSIDSQAPEINSFSITEGVNTFNNNVRVNFTAQDTISPITHFCLKYNTNSQPGSSDSCWVAVNAPSPGITPAKNISVEKFYYQIGFSKGSYAVYLWVRDNLGFISTNTSTLDLDKFETYYDPGTPPSISKLLVSNSDASVEPLTSSDLIVSNGSYIYVKWNASDEEGLATNPISVYYTTNDSTYIAFSNAVDIPNQAGGNCTINASFTGCIRLTAPTSAFFRVRIIAKDNMNTSVLYNSSGMNETKLKIIAGNTESGLDGSASTSVFYMMGKSSNVSSLVKNRLVVSEDGKFFYIDPQRGLLWINPATGLLKRFINITGSSTGDGGNVSSATLQAASAIALDHQNNLLIWDNNRIRRVNLTTNIITTIIGGSGSNSPTSTVASNQISTEAPNNLYHTFIPLPNGDIIFNSQNRSLTDRKYIASTNTVEPILISGGVGMGNLSNESWTAAGTYPTDFGVIYDPVTSEISHMTKGFMKSVVGDSYNLYTRVDTSGSEVSPYMGIGPYNIPYDRGTIFNGLDGKLYHVDRFRYRISRYNKESNTLTTLVGTNIAASSPCIDGTSATSCPIDVDTVFVSKTGRIYFIDQGTLRSVNDNLQVITLFGQFPSYGDNVAAANARFGNIVDIKLGKDTPVNNKVIVLDGYNNRFREFSMNGNLTNLVDACYSSNGPYRFVVDQSAGDILSSCGTFLRRFQRSTNTWVNFVGGGNNVYYNPSSDGKIGSEIRFPSSYQCAALGLINGYLYFHKFSWVNSTNTGCTVKRYNLNDSNRQSHFIGNETCSNTFTLNTTMGSNTIGTNNFSNIELVSTTNKYLFMRLGTSQVFTGRPESNLELFATLPHTIRAFTHRIENNDIKLYYCASNGFIHRYSDSTKTATALTWSATSIRCKQSASIIYYPENNSLIFPVTQNGLDAVAEYFL